MSGGADLEVADEPAANPADEDRGHAPWRLRDLRGRDLWCAIGLLVLVLVPFVLALVRAFHDGWIPSGDEANIATRAHDVFSAHPPLTGLPSTSFSYGHRIATNHPGPIEFYILAIPLRVLGMTAGPLLTAAAINAGFALIALWVFFRRLGLTAMLWAGVLMLAVIWSAGTAILTDTLSSNMTMYSLLATAVLAWALIDGDRRLLPLAAFVATYAAQQHLAAGLLVLALVIAVLVTFAVQRRRGATVEKISRRWTLTAVAIIVLCWIPVLDDELKGDPGNLTQIYKFARDDKRPTLGFAAGIYQALHGVVPPTVLGRTDTTGWFFLAQHGGSIVVIGILMAVALIALAWRGRTASRSTARLALLTLVLLAAGIFNGGNVPKSVEEFRANLYRWTWTAAFLTWALLGIGAVLLIRRLVGSRPIARRAQRLAPVVLLVVGALITAPMVFVHRLDDHNRELPAFPLEKRVDAAVFAHIDRNRPVMILNDGNDATLSVGPQVVFRLVEAGVRVEVAKFWTTTYGPGRRYRARTNPAVIYITSGSEGAMPAAPGTLITTQFFSAERTSLLNQLAAAARGVPVELAPGAQARINREYPGLQSLYIGKALTQLPKKARTLLQQPVMLKLFEQGLISAPALDKAKVERLNQLLAARYLGTYGDERVEVHYLTPAQAKTITIPRV